MSNEASRVPQPGDLLAGKYRILRTLGVGGMGMVLAAHHEVLGHPVAVKLLLAANREPDAPQRLLNEARAAAGIHSEHVVRVLDVSSLDDGTPFIVLEYLEGRDLAAELKQRGPLPYAEVAEYMLQAMQALAQAHSIGIVHRDLKPSNLFLAHRPDGIVLKVLDFGIAKSLSTAPLQQAALTQSGATLGSPMYMSPEQLRDPRSVDQRADVWALGAIMDELVSGKPPFDAEVLGAVFAAVLERNVSPLHTRVPGMPRGFSDAVARCLQRDRKQRWASVRELAAALAPFAPKNGMLSLERIQRLTLPSAPLEELEEDVAFHGSGPQATLTAHGTWSHGVSATPNRRATAKAIVAVMGSLVITIGGIALYKAVAGRGHEPSSGAASATEPSSASLGAPPRSEAAVAADPVRLAPTSANPTAPPTAEAASPVAAGVASTAASATPPRVGSTAAPTTPAAVTGHHPPVRLPPPLSHDRSSY